MKALTIRFPDDLHAYLVQGAEKNKITKNAYIIQLLRDQLDFPVIKKTPEGNLRLQKDIDYMFEKNGKGKRKRNI